MTTVYVWLPNTRKSLGHASMKIAGKLRNVVPGGSGKIFENEGDQYYSETYISWWPAGNLLGGDGVVHTYEEDISNAYEARDPEFRVDVQTLDEEAMTTFWFRFKYKLPKPDWHVFKNCATLVAHTLRAGGGPFYLGNNVTWTPAQVKAYASQLAGGSKS